MNQYLVRQSGRRPAGRRILLALLAALLGAGCAQAPRAGTPRPSTTRIVSVETHTSTPAPPTPTVTASATVTPGASLTPIPPSATLTPQPIVRFMAVGDVMLARSVGERILQAGPGVAFAGVLPVLQTADLLAANLECVISELGVPAPKAYVFRAPPVAMEALAGAGVDVVSLANNHVYDYGVEAVEEMLPRLRESGIEAVGAGPNVAAAHAPVLVARNGVRMAFLAYVDVPIEGRSGFDTASWAAGPETPGLAWAEVDRVAADVAEASLQADVVIILFHFGLEGRPEVTASQRALAHAAIDAGAELVLGAHPHVLQRPEAYNGGLIVYSLGNFVFDGFSGLASQSAIFTATLTPAGVEAFSWVPIVVEGGLPRLATDAEAALILPQIAGG
ncbi:MAG: CapA family protein [Anaerolineales bacterium]|nr:CapA family protein [Anaerolineales bacterium]